MREINCLYRRGDRFGHRIGKDAISSVHQWTQARVALNEGELLNQPIETPDVSGAIRDQIDDHAYVDEVIVDDEVDVTLDVWEIHMREIIGAQQEDGEDSADSHQEAGDKRKPDQEVAPLHEEIRVRNHARGGEHGEEVMERLGMGQKAGDAPARIQQLPRPGIEERPSHGDPEEKDQALLKR